MRAHDEIIRSHLELRREGNVEEDIQRNFASDVVIIDRHRTYEGHDGVRQSARILAESLPGARFAYERVRTCGRMAYLVWSCEGVGQDVKGVDSFLIEDDYIRAQTIYYHA